jgi:hypothetical protein
MFTDEFWIADQPEEENDIAGRRRPVDAEHEHMRADDDGMPPQES